MQACRKQEASTDKTSPRKGAWFEDITRQVGLDFQHYSGATSNYFMPESIGSGGALFDFDNDGRLDIYLVQNGPNHPGASNRLYQQQADGRFRDVSGGSGLDVAGYGMGVAVGDVNNDGLPDVLLTEYGKVRLFQNRGGGHFEDVTRAAAIDNTRWGTGAAFFDYDRDGWLDLVIVNYVDYSQTVKCYDTRGALEYCGPQGMQGTVAKLFHNRGRGTNGIVQFEDVTVVSGLANRTGAGLGVICADFDGDHWPDIFIADDGMPNRLYINQRNGTFSEEAGQRGIAYSAFGAAAANMGVALGDVDGDGLFDIFVTHLSWEQHALWKQGPRGFFEDQTAAAGLANPALRGTGFGAVLADFDLDGADDLAFVNGRIKRGEHTGVTGAGLDSFWLPYAQQRQLFANDGSGRFREISESNPGFCSEAAVGRGLACGDIDNDGAVDLLAMNTGGPARLFRNIAPKRGHWLMVRAIEPALGGRDGHGAEVTVRGGAKSWKRVVQPGYSFLVSNDPRVHFGIGSVSQIERIEVVWADGTPEIFPGGSSDRLLLLRKGEGSKP